MYGMMRIGRFEFGLRNPIREYKNDHTPYIGVIRGPVLTIFLAGPFEMWMWR